MIRFWFLLVLISFSGALHALPRNPVLVLAGDRLSALRDLPLESIRAYRVADGRFEEIPFQIDERVYDAKEKRMQYILDRAYGAKALPDVSNGRLDAEDEIVWMWADCGEVFSGVPPLNPGYVIEVSHAATRQKRYVYIGRKTGSHGALSPYQSTKRYIAYDPERDEVKTERYETRFLSDAPFAQGTLVLKNNAAGREESVLDRFKMRFHLDLRAFFNFHLKEGDITSKRIGYKLGPIRLIRRLVLYQTLGPLRITPKVVSDYVFSFEKIHIPSAVMMPFNPKSHVRENSIGFGAFDFSGHFYGSSFYAERNPLPVVLDGETDAREKALIREDVQWWVMTGNKGHFLVQVGMDELLKQSGLKIALHYEDDARSKLPPENEVGQTMAGFEIRLHDLPQGNYKIFIDQFFPGRDFKSGDEKGVFGEAALLSYRATAL